MRTSLVAAVLRALLAVASCSDAPSTAVGGQSSSPQHSTSAAHSLPPGFGLVTISPRSPLIEIRSGEPCPARLGDVHGVRNTRPTPSGELMPHELPISGLICAYSGLSSRALVSRPVRLAAGAAASLAAALARVRLGVFVGPTSCGMGWGSTVLIVFAYQHGPDFTLWYRNSGCETVDNGRVQAGQIANPSFERFGEVFAQVAPSLHCAGVQKPARGDC